MHLRRTLLALLFLPVLLNPMAAHAEGADWHFVGQLGAGYDDNSNNGLNGRPRLSGGVLNGDAGVELPYRLSARTTLIGKALLSGELHTRYDGLNNGKFTGMLRVRHRFADAGSAPALNFWASAATWQFDNDLRDSAEYRAGVFLQKPIGSHLSGRISLSASEREADNSPVFDLSARSVGLQLDWSLASSLTLYGEYQFRDGDVVSTSAPDPRLLATAAVRAVDTAFAEHNPNMIAYRLDAETHVAALGFNYGLTPQFSLDGRVQAIHSEDRADLEYNRVISQLSLLARF